ncbi:hypothetical protein [Trueperella pyogenes]
MAFAGARAAFRQHEETRKAREQKQQQDRDQAVTAEIAALQEQHGGDVERASLAWLRKRFC